jgi:hypothetical protein
MIEWTLARRFGRSKPCRRRKCVRYHLFGGNEERRTVGARKIAHQSAVSSWRQYMTLRKADINRAVSAGRSWLTFPTYEIQT